MRTGRASSSSVAAISPFGASRVPWASVALHARPPVRRATSDHGPSVTGRSAGRPSSMSATCSSAPLRRNAPDSLLTSSAARVRRSESNKTRRACPAGAAASSASARPERGIELAAVAPLDGHRSELGDRAADGHEATESAVDVAIDGEHLDRGALEVAQERGRGRDACLAQALVERARPVEDHDDLGVARHAAQARRGVDAIVNQRAVARQTRAAQRAAHRRRPRRDERDARVAGPAASRPPAGNGWPLTSRRSCSCCGRITISAGAAAGPASGSSARGGRRGIRSASSACS